MPTKSGWSRAHVDGCVKKPVLRSDEAKLKELFICCRDANLREVRAIAFHFPWLLAMTDAHGFSALHHAEMSGDADFLSKLLELYNDPKTHMRKFVRYECEEDLALDGFRLTQNRPSIHSTSTPVTSARSRNSATDGPIVVKLVDPNSLAAAAGVVPGDTLEEVECALVHGMHTVLLTPDDISDVMNNGARLEDGFPLTLEFDGPASAEILGRNSWTPLHAAAGGGEQYKNVCRVLRQEQQKLPMAAHDGHGCTPEHWRLMSKRSIDGPMRRPLSAGPCAQRQQRASEATQQRITSRDGTRLPSPSRSSRPRALPRAPPPPFEARAAGAA